MTLIFTDTLNISAQDYDYAQTGTEFSDAKRILIQVNNLRFSGKNRPLFRARIGAGLLNANGNYNYTGYQVKRHPSNGQKPLFDTNDDNIDSLTSLVALTDSPLNNNTDYCSIDIHILNPGYNANPKIMFWDAYTLDDDSLMNYDSGGAQIKVSSPLTGFRLFTGANLIGGEINIFAF